MNEKQELLLLKQLESGNLSDRAELQVLRALEENPDDVSDLLTSLAFRGLDSGASLTDLAKRKREEEQDADFDYATGGDAGLRARLSFGETGEEKEAILKSLVGEEGYTKDSKGQLALTEIGQKKRGIDPVGKNLVIEDKGFSFGDIADLAGVLPEAILGTAGAILGGTAGTIVPGAGTIGGAALGGGAGSAAGQAIEEGIESLLGFQRQTGKEIAKDVAIEGAIGAGGSILGDLVIRAGRGILGLGKGVTGKLGQLTKPTDEIEAKKLAIGRRVTEKGALPSFESVGAPRPIAYAQKVSETASKQEGRLKANIDFALKERDSLIAKLGGGKSLEEAAENIGNVAGKKLDDILEAQKSAQSAALKAADDNLNLIEKATKEGFDINESTLKNITRAFENFSDGSTAAFKSIDEKLAQIDQSFKIGGANVTGGQLEVFSTAPLKNLIKDLQEQFGTTDVLKEQTKRVISIVNALGDRTSFSKLSRARKSINDELFDYSIGPTTRNELTMFRNAMDEMIDKSRIYSPRGGEVLSDVNKQRLKDAAKLRKKAMDDYRTGLKRFEDLEKFGLIRSIREAASEEGEKFSLDRFYDSIVRKNSPERLKAIIRATDNPNDTRSTLARTFLDNALSKSRGELGKFNGEIFRRQVTNLGTTGKVLFGDKFAEVEKLSKAIAFNGLNKLDDDVLKNVISLKPGEEIVDTFKRLNQANIDATEAFKSRTLQKLRDPSSSGINPQEAVELLTSPSITKSEIQAVKRFFGDNSDAFNDIKKRTLERILEPIDDTIFSDTSAARAFSEQVKRYQKNGIIKEILGKDGDKALNELAEDLIFLNDFTKEGAIAAASITINPIANLGKLARMTFTSKFLANKQSVMKYIELQEAMGKKTAESKAVALNGAINEAMVDQGISPTRKAAEQIIPRLGAGDQRGTRTNVPNVAAPDPNTNLGLTDIFNLIQTPKPAQTKPTVPLGPIERIRQQAQEMRQNNIRQRAATNPAVAASLLGGLGSASLLD